MIHLSGLGEYMTSSGYREVCGVTRDESVALYSEESRTDEPNVLLCN